MKKSLLALIGCVTIMGAALSGCGKEAGTGGENSTGIETVPEDGGESGINDANVPASSQNNEESSQETESEKNNGEDPEKFPGAAAGTTVTQGGPFGAISLTVPAGWKYELCPMDSDSLLMGDYGIYFAPEGQDFGFVEVAYIRSFGVCGTELAQEEVTVAGYPAWKGTYDGHAYWEFISFKEPMRDVVAMTSSVEEWWEENEDTVMEILDTLTFDPNVREGGAYIYEKESENEYIGLSLSLEGVSSTGAMLCYNQYDKEAPTGQLQDGDDFVIEVKKEDKWEQAPIVVEGDYGFNAMAYTISPGDTTRRELNWEWLYGELAPGEYRLCKRVFDFRGAGDYDMYALYAYFILN